MDSDASYSELVIDLATFRMSSGPPYRLQRFQKLAGLGVIEFRIAASMHRKNRSVEARSKAGSIEDRMMGCGRRLENEHPNAAAHRPQTESSFQR